MHDNKSVILLENNGKFSNSKIAKHINTRYLFVTDRVSLGGLEIEHFPREII